MKTVRGMKKDYSSELVSVFETLFVLRVAIAAHARIVTIFV
jgi:hypothetical protein